MFEESLKQSLMELDVFSEKTVEAVRSELVKALVDRKLSMCTAESCTGGLLSKLMTDSAGSSAYFAGGFVVYSNDMKQSLLAVSADVLKEHGAVSEPVARQMAVGAIYRSMFVMSEAEGGNNDGEDIVDKLVSVSITGIAGPDGGSVEKPVGTVCFGFALADKKTETITLQLSGNREQVRQSAAIAAMMGLTRFLEHS